MEFIKSIGRKILGRNERTEPSFDAFLKDNAAQIDELRRKDTERFDRVLSAIKEYPPTDGIRLMKLLTTGSMTTEKMLHTFFYFDRARNRDSDDSYRRLNLANAFNFEGSPARVSIVDIPTAQDVRVQAAGEPDWRRTHKSIDQDHNTIRIREDHTMHFFDSRQDVVVPNLAQCRGIFIFNLNTGRYSVYHSSVSGFTAYDIADIAHLGAGPKCSVIIGERTGEAEANLLRDHLNIPSEVFRLRNASSHIQIALRAREGLIKFVYNDHSTAPLTYWLGKIPIPTRK